jgi:hypothetical protein
MEQQQQPQEHNSQQQQDEQQELGVTDQAHQTAAAGASEHHCIQHQQQAQGQLQQAGQEQQQQQYPSGLPPSTTSILAQVQAQVTLQQVPGCPPDNREQWQDWTKVGQPSKKCSKLAAGLKSPTITQCFTEHLIAMHVLGVLLGHH